MWHSVIVVTLLCTLRACEEESKARMGVVECLNHNMVEPFNVLYEKDGEGMDDLVVHDHAVVFPAPGKTFLPCCLLERHIPYI